MTNSIQISVYESMFIVDGGSGAALPAGAGGPILAGPEAVFIAGRVEYDAPTLFRVGSDGGQGDLIMAHSGVLATPHRTLRVVNVEQEVLGEVTVSGVQTLISVYLTDFDEPDEIFVQIHAEVPEKGNASDVT